MFNNFLPCRRHSSGIMDHGHLGGQPTLQIALACFVLLSRWEGASREAPPSAAAGPWTTPCGSLRIITLITIKEGAGTGIHNE